MHLTLSTVQAHAHTLCSLPLCECAVQYSFQFGGYGASQSSTGTTPALSLPAAPRFNVQAPLVAPATGGGEESDDDEESGGDEGAVSLAKTSATESVTVATPAAANGEESEEDGGDSEHERAIGAGLDISTVQSEERKNVQSAPPSSSNASLPSPSLKNVVVFTTAAPLHKQKLEDDDAHWSLDGSPEDGIQLMGDSIVSRLQPSLDDSIHRIAELTESQEVRPRVQFAKCIDLISVLTRVYTYSCGDGNINSTCCTCCRLKMRAFARTSRSITWRS